MTYHDRRLSVPGAASAKPERSRLSGAFRGINDMSLFPSLPDIKLGSVADDWRAVGGDIRKAMKKFEKNG